MSFTFCPFQLTEWIILYWANYKWVVSKFNDSFLFSKINLTNRDIFIFNWTKMSLFFYMNHGIGAVLYSLFIRPFSSVHLSKSNDWTWSQAVVVITVSSTTISCARVQLLPPEGDTYLFISQLKADKNTDKGACKKFTSLMAFLPGNRTQSFLTGTHKFQWVFN